MNMNKNNLMKVFKFLSLILLGAFVISFAVWLIFLINHLRFYSSEIEYLRLIEDGYTQVSQTGLLIKEIPLLESRLNTAQIFAIVFAVLTAVSVLGLSLVKLLVKDEDVK